jgi:hypothetical protein
MVTTLAPLLTRWCSVPKASPTTLKSLISVTGYFVGCSGKIYRDQHLDKMVKRNGLPEG